MDIEIRDNDIVDLVYERLSSAIPPGVTRGEALRAALRLTADCIHQIDKSDDNDILMASIGILRCEFKNFQEKFGK